MTNAEYKFTAEYDYVSPSMYAYAKSMNTRPERTVQVSDRKLKEIQKPENQVYSRRRTQAHLSFSQTMKTVLLLCVVGALMIGIVWANAKSSQIKYSINQLEKQNSILQNEITLLEIEIEGSNSIQSIEDYATSKLGMVYASGKHCVYLEKAKSSTGLADNIKAKAYKES